MDETARHRQEPTYDRIDTYEKVRRLVDFESGAKFRILDVGCGSGLLDDRLRRLGHEVVGLDINEVLEYDDAKYMRCDINCAWPAAEENFDLVICTDVPEHMYDPKHILAESGRVLKADGRLIFGVPNHFDLRQRLRMLLGRGIVHWDNLRCGYDAWDFPHIRFFTLPEIEARMEKEGWHMIRRQYNFMGCGIIPSCCKLLNGVLLRAWPGLFSGKFVVLAGRSDRHELAEDVIYVPKTYPGM
jgi:SAM-dependent methyltransferase